MLQEGGLTNPKSYKREVSSNKDGRVALNVLMKKGHWVHVAIFDSLGDRNQNYNSLAKMLKIAVFRPDPPQDVKNFDFFREL